MSDIHIFLTFRYQSSGAFESRGLHSHIRTDKLNL